MDSIRSFDKLRIAANQNLKDKGYWHARMRGEPAKSSFARGNGVSAVEMESPTHIKKFSELSFDIKEGLYAL